MRIVSAQSSCTSWAICRRKRVIREDLFEDMVFWCWDSLSTLLDGVEISVVVIACELFLAAPLAAGGDMVRARDVVSMT